MYIISVCLSCLYCLSTMSTENARELQGHWPIFVVFLFMWCLKWFLHIFKILCMFLQWWSGLNIKNVIIKALRQKWAQDRHVSRVYSVKNTPGDKFLLEQYFRPLFLQYNRNASKASRPLRLVNMINFIGIALFVPIKYHRLHFRCQ